MSHPEELTIASIELQGKRDDDSRIYGCGCFRSCDGTSWRLCQYHEGYDDGVEAASR
jgi:hypothetical protein